MSLCCQFILHKSAGISMAQNLNFRLFSLKEKALEIFFLKKVLILKDTTTQQMIRFPIKLMTNPDPNTRKRVQSSDLAGYLTLVNPSKTCSDPAATLLKPACLVSSQSVESFFFFLLLKKPLSFHAYATQGESVFFQCFSITSRRTKNASGGFCPSSCKGRRGDCKMD